MRTASRQRSLYLHVSVNDLVHALLRFPTSVVLHDDGQNGYGCFGSIADIFVDLEHSCTLHLLCRMNV